MTPATLIPFVEPIADPVLQQRLQQRIDTKTKPRGALGRLEALALQLGLILRSEAPVLRQPQLLVFAADHGLARQGVSAYPQEVTWQMVENMLAGGAAISVFARQMGLALSVVDAGVAHDFGPRPGLLAHKIAPAIAAGCPIASRIGRWLARRPATAIISRIVPPRVRMTG